MNERKWTEHELNWIWTDFIDMNIDFIDMNMNHWTEHELILLTWILILLTWIWMNSAELNWTWISSVQSLIRVWLFATPWTGALQVSLAITNSWSLPKFMSIESVIPSNHLILCRPLLLLPSIFPSIRVFSSESVLPIRWPKYWSFSLNISPSNEHPDWFPSGWTGWISLQSKGLSRVFSNTTVQKHQFFCAQLSL